MHLKSVGLMIAGTGLMMAAPVWAQDTDSNSATPQTQTRSASTNETAWQIVCPEAKDNQNPPCRMTKQVSLAQTKQRVVSTTITLAGEKSQPVMRMAAPLGLFLPAGLAFSVDGGKEKQIVFQTCNAQGCFVGTPLTGEQVDAMKRGNILNVKFQSLNRQILNVPVSLKGFTAAFRKLK